MILRAVLLAVLAVPACTPPAFRQATASDARPADRWLEGPACANAADGAEVRVETIEAGVGDVVQEGQTIRIHYVANGPRGEILRDTRDGLPHEMFMGNTRMVCGFQRGLVGMRPGERRRISAPWPLAFGELGRPPDIPPRTDLVFVVDLFLPVAADSPSVGGAGRPPSSRSGGSGRGR